LATKTPSARRSAGQPAAKSAKTAKFTPRALTALMKFRLVINTTKHHFSWVERQCGVSGAQLWALWEVQQAPGLRVSALAARMAMHQTTVSNLVDKLTRAKLMKRERSARDQRVVSLTLTDAGQRVVKRAPIPARGMLADALHRMPERQLAVLDTLLKSLLDRMRPADRDAMKQPLSEMLLK
jgi:MarR family transcriptional regulator, organic hydroperoxide resistance regulator